MKNGKRINLIYFPRAINHYKRAYNSSCPRLPRPYHTDSRRVRSCLPETVGKKTLTLRTRFPASGAFGGRVRSYISTNAMGISDVINAFFMTKNTYFEDQNYWKIR